ncbi:MAG TPA: HDIG domain-containing protein [Candidatus Desulfaltia sp.]|nr:HDIG domain-containing protein [Candidatus Desulfaltia sp.]
MNFISFRRLKLFKSPSPRPKDDGEEPEAGDKTTNFWRRIIRDPFFYLIIFVFVLAYFLSYVSSRSLPKIEEGEIAAVDIVSPVDLTIEDTETTAKRKAAAAEAVLPVYVFDKNSFLNTEEKIRQFFEFGRERLKAAGPPARAAELQTAVADRFGLDIPVSEFESLIKANFSSEIEETLVSLIAKVSSRGIIVSKNLFIRREPETGFLLIRGSGNEQLTQMDGILDIKEARNQFAAEAEKLEISARNQRLLVGLAEVLLTPNITYNNLETESRKELARDREETVFYTVKKGKVIVRKGDEATAENIKRISTINQNLQKARDWIIHFAGTFLLFALIFVALWYFLKSLLKFRAALNIYRMMGVILLVSLLAYKLAVFVATLFSQVSRIAVLTNVEVYRYAFPFQFGVIIFAFLTNNTITLIFTVLNSILVGYVFQGDFQLMLFSFLGGLAAVYGIRYYKKQKRTSALRAGLFVVAPTNAFLIIIFELIREKINSPGVFASEIGLGLLGGVLSAALAFVLLPIIENIFGFITPTKLLDLTNSDLPIFRRMAMEAPGSYHHSLIVSALAEKAAEEIGLDVMLVKAGSLYHDIGKVKRPEYFIENISRNPDLHKDMAPSLSSLVIINHVKEGVELARKLKLPKKIKEIIEQHHGSTLVRYFFHKAKEVYNPDMQTIEEESYRYPGPPPQSKEAALIMLADSIEAASRSVKNPSRESLKRLIVEIFENYLQDGQLDDCDFSLRELRAIAASFHTALYAIYQPRLEYPGFNFEMKMKKKPANGKKANDRGPQSPV